MKKLLALSLAILLSLLCFCSCESNDKKAAATESQTTQNVTEQTANIEIYKEWYGGKLKLTRILGENEHDTVYGVLDEDGKTILECKYDTIDLIGENRIYAWKSRENDDPKSQIFDAKGNIISDCEYDFINYELESAIVGYYPVGIAGKYNDISDDPILYLVDQNGDKIINTEFKWMNFNDDNQTLTVGDTDDNRYIIDFKGNKVG